METEGAEGRPVTCCLSAELMRDLSPCFCCSFCSSPSPSLRCYHFLLFSSYSDFLFFFFSSSALHVPHNFWSTPSLFLAATHLTCFQGLPEPNLFWRTNAYLKVSSPVFAVASDEFQSTDFKLTTTISCHNHTESSFKDFLNNRIINGFHWITHFLRLRSPILSTAYTHFCYVASMNELGLWIWQKTAECVWEQDERKNFRMFNWDLHNEVVHHLHSLPDTIMSMIWKCLGE
jgi:hypothetical protein